MIPLTIHAAHPFPVLVVAVADGEALMRMRADNSSALLHAIDVALTASPSAVAIVSSMSPDDATANREEWGVL